jgi:sugar lactone lactonase YvrE
VSTEGLIETVAGTGVEGFNLDEGAALEVQLDQPNGLAVMPDGNLYILDIDNRRVCKVTPEGSLTTVFRDDTEPPFLTGRGLWVSEDEETVVYASRTALKRWTRAEGTIEVLATGFERLTNIGLDVSTGDFLGADVDDGTVWRIDPEAKTRQRIAGGGRFATSGVEAREARLEGVRGLAVSEHGGYFVTTEDGGDVWYVDTSGVAHVLMVGSGSGNVRDGDGQTLEELVGSDKNIVSQPYSITIAPNGDLVLITNETGFIRVVRKGRAPQIVGMGFGEEGAFGINWTSEPRRLYLVEGSEDLSTWDLLSEVASNSNTTLFFDTQSVDLAKRHYRVRLFYP